MTFSPLSVAQATFPGDWVRHRYQQTGSATVTLGTLEQSNTAQITLNSSNAGRFVVPNYIDQSVQSGFSSLASNGGKDDVMIYAGTSIYEIGVLNNFAAGWLAADPFYRFSYLSFAQAKMFLGNTPAAMALTDDFHVIFGERGAAPPTVKKTFTARVRGAVWNKGDPYGIANIFRDVEMDAAAVAIFDPAAASSQRIQIAFTMPRSLYSSSGTARIAGFGTLAADGTIQGTLTSSDSDFGGQFSGRFYGPAGAELGLVISLSEDVGDPARAAAMLLGR